MFVRIGDITININQITYTKGNIINLSSGGSFELSDAHMARVETVMFPKRKVQSHEPDAKLLELFEKLHKLTGGKGRAVFSLDRENKLKALLTKHRLTESDLIKSATNIGNNEWLQGQNDKKVRYGTIDYMLRPDKASQYAEEQIVKKKGMF